eukprot:63299_1
MEEEYDWDAFLSDIDCYINEGKKQPNQSNIYLFLNNKKQTALFDLICKKYVIKNTNMTAINFGVSVLHWFEYGDGPKHKTFIDEIISNKYSTITKQLLDQYKTKCTLKLQSETKYKYKFFELLSLMLY